jgi:NADPH-dependent 2,4-dienoyl-CoA reductase/sulfur reductase-like enzyme
MKLKIAGLCILVLMYFISFGKGSTETKKNSYSVDICIYGGTSGGVIAAYTAKKAGKTVLLIEPGKRIGGMTTGGLGMTDIGNKQAITGLSREFYKKVGREYGVEEQWKFEPSVALKIMQDFISKAKIEVLYEHQLQGVKKKGNVIQSITLKKSHSAPLPPLTTHTPALGEP